MAVGEVDLGSLATRLADRSAPRTEAEVQSDLRAFLLYAGLNLKGGDVRLESPAGGGRRIDVEAGRTVFEVKKDLRAGATSTEALSQLKGYVADRSRQLGERYVGILTDGAEWRLYHLSGDHTLQLVSTFELHPGDPKVGELRLWLDGALATTEAIQPSPSEISRRLGAGSSAHQLERATLTALFEESQKVPAVQLKRELWARLLRTALGSSFVDDDALFVEHTYLVLASELIAHAVVGFNIADPHTSGASLVSGELFTVAGIGGVVERDFFDWVIDTPQGEQFVTSLARRLSRFDWAGVQHDVLKVLYESVIDADTRHSLGEYYTPDWLAEVLVDRVVDDPLNQRVLDPACGSGTFLFHAVRRYLEAAAAGGVSNQDALAGVCSTVFGVDLHPVAVTLARVTYLLAIGSDRLTGERGAISIPVYLGDSLQWHTDETLFARGGVTIYTTDGRELFERELHFPSRVVADVRRFDHLVTELTEKASTRSSPAVPSLKAVFQRYAIHPDDQPAIEATFESLCRLFDEGRNHIWGYYIRNLARPHWLSQPDNQVDVLVGNPPWLAYRFMPAEMQKDFKKKTAARGLWVGAQLTTHQDLSGFFVARSTELYLRDGGRFGFVLPLATLTRQQHKRFRTGDWSGKETRNKVEFEEAWDLAGIEPPLFPMPASVLTGRRLDTARPVGNTAVRWAGVLPARDVSWKEASPHLERREDVPIPDMTATESPYRDRFTQGGFVWPRVLLLVEDDGPSPLGVPAGKRRVRSSRSAQEKPPWKQVPTLRGVVESEFVRPLHLGSTIAPFRPLEPEWAIIPWEGGRLIGHLPDQLDRYPGLRDWWQHAEELWERHRPDYTTINLTERLEYKDGTSKQFPVASHRVVFTSSGSNLVAAALDDSRALVSETLYWASCSTETESNYLTAILNSSPLLALIKDLQARGQFGTRHFHKVVFAAPIPLFDPAQPLHVKLAELGANARKLAEDVDVTGMGFLKARRNISDALRASGITDDITQVASDLLAD